MAASMTDLTADLAAETEVIEQMLTGLNDAGWHRPTPAENWSIRDQIAHLAYFDETALLAMRDPDRFQVETDELLRLGFDLPDRMVREHRTRAVPDLHSWFRHVRLELLAEARRRKPKDRMPWYGPPMSLASCVTARIMETWAHGQDIADALGIERPPTERLRHVAHIGIGARPYSFTVNGLEPPAQPIRVDLQAPDGAWWTWGPEGADDQVRGTALDFCLLVTQRRHRSATRLEVRGPVAETWIGFAQAYAGPAGPGRPAPA